MQIYTPTAAEQTELRHLLETRYQRLDTPFRTKHQVLGRHADAG